MTSLRLNLEFRAEVRCGPFSNDLSQKISEGVMVPDLCEHYDTGCGVSVSTKDETAELFVIWGENHLPINHDPLVIGQTVIVRDELETSGLRLKIAGLAVYG
jgi:hypothetical protein